MRKSESGQALVLVLLSLSVVLTLVLFILSRSITDVRVSSGQEESVRAFSAAEAGIERALVIGSNNNSFENNASYIASVTNFAEGSTEIAYPFLLSSGDSATVWFKGHNADGSLTSTGAFTGSAMKICWGSGTADASAPAIEVSVYYETIPGDLSTIKIARTAIDPFSGRASPNSFSNSLDSGTCTLPVTGKKYSFQKTIAFSGFLPVVNQNGLLFARIRMFYNTTPQGVGISVTGDTLPSQGQQIDSSGTAGQSNRRILVYQSWPEFPFASNALISPYGITK